MKKGSIKGEIEMKSENGLLTYLKWRGDLSVEQAPFNDVDALALCELVYVEFDGVVPEQEDEGTVTLKEALRKYERKPHKTTVHYQEKEELFEILAQSPRYENMVLSNYVSKVDTIGQEQFAAIHIEVSPNLTVIAFRGTDNTIVGWKEDFNMSYMMPVPSQQSGVCKSYRQGHFEELLVRRSFKRRKSGSVFRCILQQKGTEEDCENKQL